ncbi:MAG: hypothetical protein Q7R54_01930 [bacterium]|nr:hypothetical protein [bacterium]
MKQLFELVSRARSEFEEALTDGLDSQVFDVWFFDDILKLFKRQRRDNIRILLRQTNAYEAADPPGHPIIAPKLRWRQMRTFLRTLESFMRGERDFSSDKLSIVRTTLEQWEKGIKRCLPT